MTAYVHVIPYTVVYFWSQSNTIESNEATVLHFFLYLYDFIE